MHTFLPARFIYTPDLAEHYTARWSRFYHPRLKAEYIAIFEPFETYQRAYVHVYWSGSPDVYRWTFTGFGRTETDALRDVQGWMTSAGMY